MSRAFPPGPVDPAAGRAGRVGVSAFVLLAALTLWVTRAHGHLLPADAGLHAWSVAHRPAPAVAAARAVTDTGTGVIPYAALLLVGLYVGRTARQRCGLASALMVCLGAGQALRYAAMSVVARPRPPVGDWAAHASGWSFPSGHTTTAAMTAGLAIAALSLGGRRVSRLAICVIGLWGAAVGLSRVYLGVHWFTDVLAGWLLAAGWVCLVVRTYLRRAPAAGRGEA
ncbi:phosphatase PAP2 family protein [Streptomyces racemochromogenes]|uniref:Phosphatase PAP2 family protein n=1 Tax=Streptomyces racemochromogenes TaxID=67353 RepID=A0ABW7PA33_9ACTN